MRLKSFLAITFVSFLAFPVIAQKIPSPPPKWFRGTVETLKPVPTVPAGDVRRTSLTCEPPNHRLRDRRLALGSRRIALDCLGPASVDASPAGSKTPEYLGEAGL